MAPSKAGQFRISEPTPGTIAVAGVLSFATAELALKGLRQALSKKGEQITLDLADVSSCDSAGLACVLAAMAEADQAGHQVRAQHVPEGMQALAQVCGVDPLLH